MTTIDTVHARGSVQPSFINVKTGETLQWKDRHNTLSFAAAKAMASAFGGDSTVIPNRIGVIYGGDGCAPRKTISREQTWDMLKEELIACNADIQIQPFSYSPSLVLPKETGDSVAIVFHSHTDSTKPGKLGISNISAEKTFIFQAVLLNSVGPEGSETYNVLARVNLDNDDKYSQKPDNFEVAIDWAVKFS